MYYHSSENQLMTDWSYSLQSPAEGISLWDFTMYLINLICKWFLLPSIYLIIHPSSYYILLTLVWEYPSSLCYVNACIWNLTLFKRKSMHCIKNWSVSLNLNHLYFLILPYDKAFGSIISSQTMKTWKLPKKHIFFKNDTQIEIQNYRVKEII